MIERTGRERGKESFARRKRNGHRTMAQQKSDGSSPGETTCNGGKGKVCHGLVPPNGTEMEHEIQFRRFPVQRKLSHLY